MAGKNANGKIIARQSNGSLRELEAVKKAMTDTVAAQENFRRYENAVERSYHHIYTQQAQQLGGMYLGGGMQWTEEEKAALGPQRLPVEINTIWPLVNAAIGYHVSNRMDIQFQPRSGPADQHGATIFNKVVQHILDRNGYRWVEREVFTEGCIFRRGYMEISVTYDENINGHIELNSLHHGDVIPDPNARSMDPDKWSEVWVRKYLTLDEIEAIYGRKARRAVEDNEAREGDLSASDDGLNGVEPGSIGNDGNGMVDTGDHGLRVPRYIVVQREYWTIRPSMMVVFPDGQIKRANNPPARKLNEWIRGGAMTIRQPRRVVMLTVSTKHVVLWSKESPFEHFSVVPFFPVMLNGTTRGLVDPAVHPQKMLNKAMSNALHMMSKTANGGWLAEENSLTNISTDDLRTEGGRTDLVIEYRKGASKPEKIEPNPFPAGMMDIIVMSKDHVANGVGISEANQGDKPTQSGIAEQAAQFAGQMKFAPILDNLARFRHMLATRLVKIIQAIYTEERVIRITRDGASGTPSTEDVVINQQSPDGRIINDITVGEYDLVITEQPTQVTFMNSQFNEALAMRQAGINIGDEYVVRYSRLADKAEILESMAQSAGKENPVEQAQLALLEAQRAKAMADTFRTNVEGLFSTTRAAQLLAGMPQLATMSDGLAKSAGFQDFDPAPIFPATPAGVPVPVPPTNTNPSTPDNPERGMLTGSEAGP